jgi:hypothetical protein
MQGIREAIAERRFAEFRGRVKQGWEQGDLSSLS